jgi:hypothetical protein
MVVGERYYRLDGYFVPLHRVVDVMEWCETAGVTYRL